MTEDINEIAQRVSAARAATEARGETFYPGASRVHLAAFPPIERWDDWVELSSRAWPAREERHYMLVPTTCFNCESACGLLAYVDRDTRQVRKFEGNPEHPGSRGRNCAKGPATINQVTDPDRVLYPLRRAGQRGEGKWERISWDEALDAIAARIRRALARGPPQRDHGAHRPPRRGRLHRTGAGQLGRGRAQLAHQRVLQRRPGRVPVLDGHRPAQPRPRARQGHLPDQRPSGGGALLQPARPADHRGQAERRQGDRRGHPAVQHRQPRRPLAVAASGQRGGHQPGRGQPPHPDRAVRPGLRPPVVELAGVPDRVPPRAAGHLRGVRAGAGRAVRRFHLRVRRGRVRRRRRGDRRGRRGGGRGRDTAFRALLAQRGRGQPGRLAGLADAVPHIGAARRRGHRGRHVPQRVEQVRAPADPHPAAPVRVAGPVLARGVPAGPERAELPAAALPEGRPGQARHLLHPGLQPGVDQPRRAVLDGGAHRRDQGRLLRGADPDLERVRLLRRLRAADGPRPRTARHALLRAVRRAVDRLPAAGAARGPRAARRAGHRHPPGQPGRGVGGERVVDRAVLADRPGRLDGHQALPRVPGPARREADRG